MTFWIIGFVWSLVNVVLCYFRGAAWIYNATMVHVTLAQLIAFTILALVTYSVIFWKYKKSRDSLHRFEISDNTERNEQSSALQMFRNSRFYVSILISTTFLVFITIPFCVDTFLSANGQLQNDNYSTSTAYNIAEILGYLGYTSDAIIYIFLQKDVRKTLLGMIYCCRENQGENLHQSSFTSQIMDSKRSTEV